MISREHYALQKGGYIGLHSADEGKDFEKKSIKDYFTSGNSLLIGLSKRQSLDEYRCPIPELPSQWTLETQFGHVLSNSIAIVHYTALGFGNEQVPWRLGHGIGLNISQ